MFVVSRKEGEQIVVPDCRVTVTVFDIHGERVRLGVAAPAGAPVYRGELIRSPRCSDTQRANATRSLEDTPMSVRVLIADPNQYLLDGYREYLEQQGCEVTTVTDGVECIEKLRDCPPDVLVLEPSIPWGGGDGVLALMHEEPNIPLIPVIVLTNGRDRGVLYRLAPFKIDDYQIKPLSTRGLTQRIRSVLACRRNIGAAVIAGVKGLEGVQ